MAHQILVLMLVLATGLGILAVTGSFISERW
jgi:hypothetical protein